MCPRWRSRSRDGYDDPNQLLWHSSSVAGLRLIEIVVERARYGPFVVLLI